MDDLSGFRIQPKQPSPCCQPQHAGPILTDFAHIVPYFTCVDPIVSEGFVNAVEPVKELIAPHPERSRTILEQRVDVNTAQAVLASRIMREHSELISIVSVETILSAEPHESLIVLDDLSNLGLGQSLGCRESRESDIVAIDCGNSHGDWAATAHF